MDTKTKTSNRQMAREAREKEQRVFKGNVHDACRTNLFYTHNHQCVHCKDERDAGKPKMKPDDHPTRMMTSAARQMYIDGATILEVVDRHNLTEHTVRTDLKDKGLLRSRGKRKQHKMIVKRERNPSYNDKKERKESLSSRLTLDIMANGLMMRKEKV